MPAINSPHESEELKTNISPLAARMRPRTLDEFTGQGHIIGPGRLLRRAIQADQLSSVIFFGPPGTGKTTLAQIIANTTRARFIAINAVLSGVKEIRESIEKAKMNRMEFNQRTILFIDEVHRFNKAQQDALLPHVESGLIILIGATTENPYFEVNKALVSRSRIFQLKPLDDNDIREIIISSINDKERGYGNLNVKMEQDAIEHLVRISNGDARSALNALELAVETTPENENGEIFINVKVAEESIQRRAVLYDKDGDTHYDTISAFIKSIRGSDPDAALYWMAKMLYAGEDPRFIFRRMLILASEDVGLADPNSLNIVVSAARAFEYVGLPEGQFHLSQACLYLSTAPKSNSTMAFFDAVEAVNREKEDEVPDHLKDGQRDKNDFGHGKGYLYPHAYREHWVVQQYLPQSLQGKIFYTPSDIGYENKIKEMVTQNRELQLASSIEKWNDNLINEEGKATGLKNNWLNRALGQATEILGKIRKEIFSLSNVKRENLLLDITGGSGLLTWEACRRCYAGGVWTRCDDPDQLKAFQEWVKHMEILNRPELFLSQLDNLKDYFGQVNEKPVFDIILGLDITQKTRDISSLLFFLISILEKSGKIILASKSGQNSQYLSELLSVGTLGKSLHDKIFEFEKSLRSTNTSILSELINKSKDYGFSKSNLITKDIIVKRHFTINQVKKWFEINTEKISSSVFSIAKKELTENNYYLFRAVTLDTLGDRDINWKQAYEIAVFNK